MLARFITFTMMVVMTKVGNSNIHKILVDNSSVADILYLSTYKKMGLAQEYLRLVSTSLYGFTGDSLIPLRKDFSTKNYR